MSTTNRAFIKAYRTDPVKDSPAEANQPAAMEPARGLARERVEVAVTTAPPHAPPLHATFKPPIRSVGPSAGSAKQPLSAYLSQPQTKPATLVEDANILKPGTTLASFQWPKTCRALSLQTGPQLDTVIDMIRPQADAGYSLVGVMGLFPRVGTTTTAMCLAARAARRTRRTILVDANFCHPRIASWLDTAPTTGWEEVLGRSQPLADAVIRATNDNLDLLALGPNAAKNPQSLATSLQAAVTAGVLRHTYDLALIDIGTFFDPVSQPIVLDLVRNMGIDSVVAVAGGEPADPRDLATIHEYFEPSDCQLIGTIENRVTQATT